MISRTECHDKGFKDLAQKFSAYASLDFIVLDFRKETAPGILAKIRQNWLLLERQNVIKANILCNDSANIPADKDSISQRHIFNAQTSKLANYDSRKPSGQSKSHGTHSQSTVAFVKGVSPGATIFSFT